MSSHHFVRADQATCLYFINTNFDEDLMFQLLEWNPVVIAKENMLDWLISRNVKIDVLVTTSAENKEALLPYQFEQWKKLRDEEIILKIIQDVKTARLTFMGCQEIASIQKYQFGYPDIEITLLENNRKHFLIKENKHFKKWVNKDYKFMVSDNDAVEMDSDIDLKADIFSTCKDGTIVIHTNEDIIFTEFL